MALYSFWNNRAQKAAEELDYKGITFNHVTGPQFTTFLLRAVPIFFAVYFGQPLVDGLLQNTPEIVSHIISVLGGVLPALGIAMLMNIVIKDTAQFIFFFAGFVLMAFAGLSMIALVFIAALIAYIVYLSSGNQTVVAGTGGNSDVFEDDDLF